MLSVFERAVFRQFLLINAIYFCVILGLFTILNLFDNVDEFINHSDGGGFVQIVLRIVFYYGKMGLFIFDLAALSLISISIMTSLLLLKRKGQIKPFLSAGIPAYRILAPALLCGVGVMIGLKIVNREVFLGNAVHLLHAQRNQSTSVHLVAPRYDHASQILIDGWGVFPEESRIEQAAFVLPPEIAGNEMVCLKAAEALFYPQRGKIPSGWLLKQVQPPIDTIPLTPQGQQFVRKTKQSENVFVVSDISPDLIYRAKESSGFLSTSQLISRINSPAIDTNTAKELEFNLHARFIEPLLTGMMVWIAIPLVLQRESKGMIYAANKCGFWLFLIIGSTFGVRFLVGAQIAEPVQAAWLPLLMATPVTVWMLDRVET